MNEEKPDAEIVKEEKEVSLPGTVLKRAREARGMSLSDVADATRVALRQLEAVERNDFGALPGTPYAVGFARAYARAVGVDEVEIARGVRQELGTLGEVGRYEAFEPVDPDRLPSRRLAWTAGAIALLLIIAYAVWRTQFFVASTDEEISDLSNRVVAQAPVAVPTVRPQEEPGPVVLTAVSEVWLRIYDQAGDRLFEKQMAKGESYTVPPEANNPMILTGRPDALSVTVGGKPVAPLGAPERTISDVPVSATALLARPVEGEGAAAPASRPAVSSGGNAAPRARAQETRRPAAAASSSSDERGAASAPPSPAAAETSAVAN